jgi:hypothetical protein
MTPDALLEDLRARGVELSAQGNRLRVEAPAGLLTPELRQALVTYKPALLKLLEASAHLERSFELLELAGRLGWPLLADTDGQTMLGSEQAWRTFVSVVPTDHEPDALELRGRLFARPNDGKPR